ncbi:enoyl-CoA hydratase/isomerase family protein [Novosphingopyxis sp.]|uniref:enoyl-CoA hydratase/isomerase family protein n=1 Tax=Novosphingopyxis sp. TaxID=2709690 RepID=UPI003B5CF5B7
MDYADYNILHINADGGIVQVEIDHPPVNLLDTDLMSELARFVEQIRADESARVIVFYSADDTFFIAHGDMNFIANPELLADQARNQDSDAPINPMQQLNEAVRSLPQVTIAKLAGLARGGGLEFAMAMDLRFAAKGRAGFAQNETPIGIIPGGGGTQYLTRLVGRAKALEIILGADLIGAEAAERMGLINRALSSDELGSFVDDLARRIASLPPGVVKASKDAVNAAADGPIGEGLAEENRQITLLAMRPVAAELNRAMLDAGAQTREGEVNLEDLARKLSPR